MPLLEGFTSPPSLVSPLWFLQLHPLSPSSLVLQLPVPTTLVCSNMALTFLLSCLLALLVAGLAQGIKDSLRVKVSTHNCSPCPSLCKPHAWGSPLQKQLLCSCFSEGTTETEKVIDMLMLTQGDRTG